MDTRKDLHRRIIPAEHLRRSCAHRVDKKLPNKILVLVKGARSIDSRSQKVFTVDCEVKAQFAVSLTRQDVYELKIPKDNELVKKTLTKYRKYLATWRTS